MPLKNINNKEKKKKNLRILFFSSKKDQNELSTFIAQDIELLKKHYSVSVIYWKDFRFWRLIKEALKADVYFTWFCGTNSFVITVLSKIFNKKAVAVVGGYDAVYMPEIGYGLGAESRIDYYIKRLLRNFTFRHIDYLFASSQYLIDNARKLGATVPIEKNFPVVDTEVFSPGDEDVQRNIILTVAHIDDLSLMLKGFLCFVRAIPLLQNEFKNLEFVIVGEFLGGEKALKNEAERLGVKVKLTGVLYGESLINYFKKAVIYIQGSRSEGFGLSLAEAMSCGCIPVGTRMGAIPEVIGDTGFYFAYNDPEDLARTLKYILALNDDKKREIAMKARERVLKNFDVSIREKKLVSLFNKVAGIEKTGN